MTLSRECLLWLAATLTVGGGATALADGRTASLNSVVQVLPAPGAVKIDGITDDWDLTGGVWSYNDPTVVQNYSVWTHLMWDRDGIYFLARYHDKSPLKNAAAGKDFATSWRADCYQARIVFDDRQKDEHQMHVNMYYASPDEQPIMIVHHGGLKSKPPYDETGEPRPDQIRRWTTTMEDAGGKVATSKWDDGKGYNLEAFWPWEYCRTSGKPLKPGESFTFGFEAMWGVPNGTDLAHRLADGVKDESTNRIFMFRARKGWGQAVIADHGRVGTAEQQIALHKERLKQFEDYETYGSIPIAYDLPGDRDVTIAIDDARGHRVRNLIGQYPRDGGSITDQWDGLDDNGEPVQPGRYSATVLHHEPIELEFFNSVYSSATPPWPTEDGTKLWGSNHGYPTSVATRGEVTMLFFTGTEGGSGIQRVDEKGIIQWADGAEFIDGTIDDEYVYGLCKSLWTKNTKLYRYSVDGGQIVPFEDEQRTPTPQLLPDNEIAYSSSLALAHDQLWACMPGRTLLQIDKKTGEIIKIHDVGNIAAVADRDGTLYGLYGDGRVATLDEQLKPTELFTVSGTTDPARLAVSLDGQRFAISDTATNQVRVVDPAGKEIQTLGENRPGAHRPAGKFVTTDLSNPLGTGFDDDGRLWVTEGDNHCKRVTLWSDDYQVLDQFWGQSDYGATAGFAVTHDATRFIAHGIEFKLDADPDPLHRKTNEQPLIFHPELAAGHRGFVYELNGHEYAASTPGFHKAPSMSLFKRGEDGVFRECVRVSPQKKDDRKSPMTAWVDRNDNNKEDANEKFEDVPVEFMYWSNGWMRPDLTFVSTNGNQFEPNGFSKGGVPLYDFAKPKRVKNWVDTQNLQGSTGTPVMDMAGNVSDGIMFHTADGQRGSYPNLYGRHNAPAAQRGLLIAPFRTNGVVEEVPGVGSMTALGGDRGEWFLLSMDGLYISSIAQDIKSAVTLDETYIGPESFGGFIWRDADTGRVLLQLGGPSYRLMEVLNLDTCVTETVSLDIDAAAIREGQRIAQQRKQDELTEPPQLQIARVKKLPTAAPAVDPSADQPLIEGASEVTVTEQGNPKRRFRAAMAHDGRELAVVYMVADDSPWQNGSGQYTHAFIGGDAVDLQLEIPGGGDVYGPIRLLVAEVSGEPTAVFWQQNAKAQDNPTTYVVANNPGNASAFDVVRQLRSAQVNVRRGEGGYSVLLRVPLKELGLDDAAGQAVKGVVGVIYSDPSGTNRAVRLYWHDKETGMVSDVPSESRLTPDHWGPIQIAPR